MRRLAALAPALALALLLPAPGPAQAQAGAESAESHRMRAQVLTVDRQANQILLRDLATGEVFVHEPTPDLAGMLNLSPGQVVNALYTYGVTVRPAGPEDRPVSESERLVAPARTGSGGEALVSGTLTRSVVTLDRWDPETSIAYGTTPEGEGVSHRVVTDEGRAFLATQSPGARLEVEISATVVVERE